MICLFSYCVFKGFNSIQFNSIYLFAIENYMNRSKKNYLVSHEEEAQKKLAGL